MEIEIRKKYFENGKLYQESSYLNGNRHGFQKYYYPNGDNENIWIAIHDQATGIQQYWKMHNNTRSFIRQWKNHRINGIEIIFCYGN